MKYRRIGSSGAKVSSLALGTDNILNPTPEDESIRMIHAALDAGVTMIDTAHAYADGQAERVIGKTLAESGRRSEAFVATKVHYATGPGPNQQGNSRAHIMEACEAALRRLQTDYIDLYATHRPDFNTPLEETLGALTDLVRQGKVRSIGSSTSPAWHTLESVKTSEAKGLERFVSEQPPYNILDRRIENEIVPMALAHGLGLFPWSPMAMGVLAGRYADENIRPDDSRAALRGGIYAERVSEKAVHYGNQFVHMMREGGYDAAQMAVCWVKDQPGVTAPLLGPKTVQQLEHLLPVADMTLPDDVAAEVDLIVAPGSAVANFHNSATWMKMQL
jgi:aryl-alcohol dehydrogenase-like predicted oxidoreductase